MIALVPSSPTRGPRQQAVPRDRGAEAGNEQARVVREEPLGQRDGTNEERWPYPTSHHQAVYQIAALAEGKTENPAAVVAGPPRK